MHELAKRIGSQPPPVTADNYDIQEDYLGKTIAEHYGGLQAGPLEIPPLFDAALRDIFPPLAAEAEGATAASEFMRRHRRKIVWSVFHWTGLNYDLVRALVVHLEGRCESLQLQVGKHRSAKLMELIAMITTLSMNRLHTGEFAQK